MEADRSVLKRTLIEGAQVEAYQRRPRGSVIAVPDLLDSAAAAASPAMRARKSVVATRSRKGSALESGIAEDEEWAEEEEEYRPFEWLPEAIVEHHQEQLEANAVIGGPVARRGSSIMGSHARKRSSVMEIQQRINAMI